MGPDTIVPLAGMLTGLAVTIGVAAAFVKIFQGPVGQALARRITGRAGSADAELAHEVEDLRAQLEQVQQRLLDAEERIDFSERLLTQRAEGAERRG
jgi:hypothetical protein